MVYDESINLIVLTAGNTATQHQDDTWTYYVSANTWTELTPTGSPDQLKWPSMTYDSVNQKCILFGGQIGDNAVDRTWIYDAQLNTWLRRYPTDAPEDRINTGLAFDPANNVTILFGGMVIGGGVYDDTWAYSYDSNVWTNMTIGAESTTTPTTTSTPTISNGPGFEPLLTVLIPSSMIIVAVVVVVFLIRRKT